MKNKISISLTIILTLLVLQFSAFSQAYKGELYQNLIFNGDHIVYNGEKIELGPNAFFIDGQMSDEEVAKYKYVFNSVNKASGQLTDGTEATPMVLYIAPWVYWIDNPDDPAIRMPKGIGGAPFGLEIDCEWLKFHGLSDDPQNVVLACNRGQTMGSKGNFTMFNIVGNGTSTENVTFGNYCNIDLEYPLKPELNREKRGSAIVQAQLAFCRGDKIFARNSHFVSRLNLCPLIGGGRTFFDRCHFESTDDALATGVYLNCTFEFYASKPFGGTSGTGAVFLNCDIKSFTRGEQYLIKSRGPIAVLDSRMEGEHSSYWGWKEKTPLEERHYQYQNQLNGEKVFIDTHHPYATVEMGGKNVLNAYRFEYDNNVVYNIYNLLRGDDDWDPMNMKDLVLKAQEANGKKYIDLPTQLTVLPTRKTIETGKETILLTTTVKKYGNFEIKETGITWSIAPEFQKFAKLKLNSDGTCEVIPTNNMDDTKEVIIVASTSDGLESASVLYIAPSFLDAPDFLSKPVINKLDGMLNVNYKLDMRFDDQSLISWFRCSDKNGNNPIEIAVSRENSPKYTYELSKGDIGYYIMAKVQPKHIRCDAGDAVSTVFSHEISADDVKKGASVLLADLKSMSAKYQPEVIPGFWTMDCFAPEDTHDFNWEADNSGDPWYYGPGINGAANDTGFVQASKGARLRYTPVGKKFGDMKISFTAVPSKTAGQGFSSARAQYMDICLKFDTKTLNGYGLRLIRTTKYHDAIDCFFVKYTNGNAVAISEPVSTSCYRTPCFITLETVGDKIKAHAETNAEYYIEPNRTEVVQVLDMECKIDQNDFGGLEFQHTGTVGSGATLIKDLVIEWK